MIVVLEASARFLGNLKVEVEEKVEELIKNLVIWNLKVIGYTSKILWNFKLVWSFTVF